MRQINPDLKTSIKQSATTFCYCWQLIRNDNIRLGFTDHDRNITFDNLTFEATSGLSATDATTNLGLATGGLDVAGALRSNRITTDDIEAGKLDNAVIKVYLVNWRDISQRCLIMTGNIGEITRIDGIFKTEIRSLSHKLDQQQGRVFQYECDADVGDNRCKVNLKSPGYSYKSTVGDNPRRLNFTANTASNHKSGLFTSGSLHWLSGANTGSKSHIKSHVHKSGVTTFELWQLPPKAIKQHDQFIAYAGCDRSFFSCKNIFNNQSNFRGFPHIPGNDFALSYPDRNDGKNDGSPMVK